MRKTTRFLLAICMLVLLFCLGITFADKHSLRTKIVRLHIVANSNCIADQLEKLAVKDAVMCYLDEWLSGVSDITEAKELIAKKLPNINDVANSTLSAIGSKNLSKVTLSLEEFDRRDYDTFSLPAGVYESLRIQIGTGQGKNWWCVVFPALCIPTTTDSFQSTAVSSGFDQGLSKTLSNEPSYAFRFIVLDCIGKIEKFLNIS